MALGVWRSPESNEENIQLTMEFNIIEDVSEELEDFIFLSRLGLFKEAHELFDQNLNLYLQSFPILVKYTDLLMEMGLFEQLSEILVKPSTEAKFSAEQKILLSLIKALSDISLEPKPNMARKQLDHAKSNLEDTLKLAQNWHDKMQNDSHHFNELEIHTLEIYLSIIVLANTTCHNLDEKYYHPPNSRNCKNQWDGFQEWCITLNQQKQFWEANKIFMTLIPVLDPPKVEILFRNYLISLKESPHTDATAVAELAATNAYLSWTSCVLTRNSEYGISPEVFEKVTRTKSLLLYLFGEKTESYRGRFNDWQQNLLLLDSKVNNGRTLFSWAAEKGHEDIIKLLIENYVDPDPRSKSSNTIATHSRRWQGRTPLLWAAANGHEAVVKLLLETGKVDVESKDSKHHQTPLSWAAENGHEEVVKVLLKSKEVKVDSEDIDKQTPLAWAAANGHETIVKLLLNTEKANVNSRSSYGLTPLSWAAESCHEKVIMILLETKGVEVDSRDYSGRTSLSWAAVNGHEAVFKLLLETGRVDVESEDSDGHTPLSWAKRSGHDAVLKLLDPAYVSRACYYQA